MLYQIRIYHNDESRCMPYKDGQRLTAAVSHSRHVPAATRPEALADWAFHVFNAELDHLEHDRATPDSETAFLAACVYRLLGLRSLSVGDVVEVATGRDTWWLACDPFGWRRISAPPNTHGTSLTSEHVYRHLRDQRKTR